MATPELFAVRFDYLDGQPTAGPMYHALTYLLEKQIDKLKGRIPDYLGEAIGCKNCPAIRAGKECLINRESGPMPGRYKQNEDIPRYFRFRCSGQEVNEYTPCMQSFKVSIADIHTADMYGVKPFQNK